MEKKAKSEKRGNGKQKIDTKNITKSKKKKINHINNHTKCK